MPKISVLRSHAGQAGLLGVMLLVATFPRVADAGVRVGLYPVQGEGQVTEKSRTDVRNLVATGLLMAEPRYVFAARKPLVVPERCAAPATTECLAGLAGEGGAIIFAVVKEGKTALEITLELITSTGARTKPIRFKSEVFMQDDRLSGRAIEALERAYLELVTVPIAELPPEPVATQEPSLFSERPATEPSSDAETSYDASGSTWHTPAAIGFGVGGVAVFGAGAVYGLLAKGLNDDLTQRYNSLSLVPGDREKYERLKTYNLLATTMMIGGGALAAAGVTFWALSPSVGASSDGPSFGLQGRF